MIYIQADFMMFIFMEGKARKELACLMLRCLFFSQDMLKCFMDIFTRSKIFINLKGRFSLYTHILLEN